MFIDDDKIHDEFSKQPTPHTYREMRIYIHMNDAFQNTHTN